MLKTSSIFAVGLSLLVACGGGDDDESDTDTTTDTASAGLAVESVADFRAAMQNADGATAAGSVYALGASASAIIQPSSQSARRTGEIARATTGTCDCTESGCTFEACADDTAGYEINGTITVDGDNYTFNLDLDYDFAGQAWAWHYEGAFLASATELDGNLEAEGDGTLTNQEDGSEINLEWSWGVVYNSIELDSSSCAIGGSLEAEVSYSGNAGGQAFNYSGSGEVAFGPACGDATAQ
jgi:hypothetical protein